jgi:hypothetical protein
MRKNNAILRLFKIYVRFGRGNEYRAIVVAACNTVLIDSFAIVKFAEPRGEAVDLENRSVTMASA